MMTPEEAREAIPKLCADFDRVLGEMEITIANLMESLGKPNPYKFFQAAKSTNVSSEKGSTPSPTSKP